MISSNIPPEGDAGADASAREANGEANRQLSELLGSLAELRGFVTEGELSRWGTPLKPAMHADSQLEHLLVLSKDAFTNEDDAAELRHLFELRVQVACLSLSELTDEDINVLAAKPEFRREDLETARRLARDALTGDHSARDEAARFLFEERAARSEDVAINDLLSRLRRIGRWPGDPSSPLVREYQDALSAAVVRHARFARRQASRAVGGVPPALIMLASLDGLRAGLERFVPDLGFKPMTYADWWARQRILRLRVQHGGDIRAPIHFWDASAKLRRVVRQFLAENGELPSVEELAKVSDFSKMRVERILAYGLQSPRDAWEKVGVDGESEADKLFNDEDVPLRRQVMRQALRGLLDQAISRVHKERDRDLMRRRFQWDAQAEPETLESIGQDYKVTRERIRQIESQILEKFAASLGTRLKELIQKFDVLP
jgi:RNA polymerase sigma factor (sigma-70 family)